MDRNAEYNALMASLSETPLKLDYAVDRAQPRYRKWKKRRCIKRAFGIPLGTVAALCAAFIVLVNASPAFAAAASRVPWLAEFADFVQYSPGLHRAADADYVQPILQTQTVNGVTVNIEGAFSDERQINLYFTVSTDDGRECAVIPALYASGSGKRQVGGGNYGGTNGQLYHWVWDYWNANNEKTPQRCKLVMQIFESPNAVDTNKDPHTDLTFDISLSDAAETQWIQLDGTAFTVGDQRLTLTGAAVSPTQARLFLRADPANTALVQDVSFYLEDETGRYYGVDSFTYAVSSDTGAPTLVCADSPYFTDCKHLTLCITNARLMAKGQLDSNGEAKPVRIDLTNKTADFLPEGVTFESAERAGNGWSLSFSAPELTNGANGSIWSGTPLDANGNQLQSSLTNTFESFKLGSTGRYVQRFSIDHYTGAEVWLYPDFTSLKTLTVPVRVKIK